MAPLSVNLTPLGLWSIKKWIRLARRYVIPQHKTLVPMVTLGVAHVGRLVVVIDVNPSHGFWTKRLMKLFEHEGK
jgi:hypothetical protein